MTGVRIKICGITRPEDALSAAELGVDALGFNFWPHSKRHVSPEAARSIVVRLPPFVTPVGVFVNQGYDDVMRAAERSGVRALQLHGDEPPDFCIRFPYPVIKALRVDGPRSLLAMVSYEVSAFLLDTPGPEYGGSGRVFDWGLAREAAAATCVILAGGLTPRNVASAIEQVRPYAVDVATGVEISPGVKDHARMSRFITAARRAVQKEPIS